MSFSPALFVVFTLGGYFAAVVAVAYARLRTVKVHSRRAP